MASGGGGGGGGGGSGLQLDRSEADAANLVALRRLDPLATRIVLSSSHVVIFKYDDEHRVWQKQKIEGPLFIVQRAAPAGEAAYRIIVNNRESPTMFVQDLTPSLEFQRKPPYLMFRNPAAAGAKVQGIWFQHADDITATLRVLNHLQSGGGGVAAPAAAPVAAPPAPAPVPAPAPAPVALPVADDSRRLLSEIMGTPVPPPAAAPAPAPAPVVAPAPAPAPVVMPMMPRATAPPVAMSAMPVAMPAGYGMLPAGMPAGSVGGPSEDGAGGGWVYQQHAAAAAHAHAHPGPYGMMPGVPGGGGGMMPGGMMPVGGGGGGGMYAAAQPQYFMHQMAAMAAGAGAPPAGGGGTPGRPATMGGLDGGVAIMLTRKQLQAVLLEMCNDESFIDALHAKYSRMVAADAARR
mgnify:CR=1 FL=1